MTTIKEETITPKEAREILETSYGNRPIRQAAVLEYAVTIDKDKWSPTASKIVIDEKGKLIDGHHRLEACVLANKPFRTLVQRGGATSDRDVIDTGAKRSLNDLFSMYTTQHNISNYTAALNQCANMLTRGQFRRPRLQTLNTAKQWAALFADGLDYVIPEVVRHAGNKNYLSLFRNGYIAGAFVFAFKRNPSKTKEFMKQVMHGDGITSDMPSYTVRNFLINLVKGERQRNRTGSGINEISLKILSGLYAFIKGTSYKTAQAGREGYEYFLEAYDTAQVKNIMEPYLKLTVEREKSIKELEQKAKKSA